MAGEKFPKGGHTQKAEAFAPAFIFDMRPTQS